MRVSAPPTLASHVIAPNLAALRRRWPGIDLVLLGEKRNTNLMAHEADLAVRLSRPTSAALATRPLGDLGYGLYATPEVLARPEAEWEFIGYDDTLRHMPQQRWLAAYAGARRMVLRCSDLAAIHRAALTGWAWRRFRTSWCPQKRVRPCAGCRSATRHCSGRSGW